MFDFAFRLQDAIDILVLGYLFYQLLKLMSGTRALQIFIGLLIIIIASLIAQAFSLTGVNWIVNNFRDIWFIGVLVLFQPELRLALANIGQSRVFRFFSHPTAEAIDELVSAAVFMSRVRQGALIVLERDQGLKDFYNKGIELNATISEELLVNIFINGSPLHDGACIISGGKLMAAAVMLPLTDNPNIMRNMGARHRAALGISEQCDALALVVSEESGAISLAVDGRLIRIKDEENLHDQLERFLLRRRR